MARAKPLIVTGAVLTTAGGLAFAVSSDSRSACNSTLGQLAQGFDHQTASGCAAANAVWSIGLIVAIVGAVLLVAGLILRSSRKQPYAQGHPTTPPPGWYPQPLSPWGVAWWDGYQWRPEYRPPG